ncbi:MAG: hypothetical protein WBP81_03215 [Solirubrobacteraceae bacterium]
MPWAPELFSVPVLQRLEEKWRHELVTVPFFGGLMAGEFDALVGSFAGVPELHHPVRGRIRGARAFEAFVIESKAWTSATSRSRTSSTSLPSGVVLGRWFSILHLDGEIGRVDLPVAIVTDRQSDGRIDELRIYYSSWPLTGRHANRPPLLQPDPELRESDVVAEYQGALSAGTTSFGGARPSSRRRPGSLSTFGVRAASSLRPASTTTSTRRSVHIRSRPGSARRCPAA